MNERMGCVLWSGFPAYYVADYQPSSKVSMQNTCVASMYVGISCLENIFRHLVSRSSFQEINFNG